MHASVFLHAVGAVIETERAVFAVTRRFDVEGQAKLLEVVLHVPGATLTQDEIVGGRSDFIAAAFQEEARRMLLLQPFRIGFHDGEGVGAQVAGVGRFGFRGDL